jgi:hypothetical protein
MLPSASHISKALAGASTGMPMTELQVRQLVLLTYIVVRSNYVFKPTADSLSLRSNLAAGGGLTRR